MRRRCIFLCTRTPRTRVHETTPQLLEIRSRAVLPTDRNLCFFACSADHSCFWVLVFFICNFLSINAKLATEAEKSLVDVLVSGDLVTEPPPLTAIRRKCALLRRSLSSVACTVRLLHRLGSNSEPCEPLQPRMGSSLVRSLYVSLLSTKSTAMCPPFKMGKATIGEGRWKPSTMQIAPNTQDMLQTSRYHHQPAVYHIIGPS